MKINEMTALLSGEARTAAAHADAEITSAYAGVVFLRGKEPEASILELAEKCGVCVLTSPLEMYDACGILHQHGVTGAK